MPDWGDIKDLYEVGSGEEPKKAQEPQPEKLPSDPRCMRVELPGLPRFMTLPVPLQRLARKKEYIIEIKRAFADRADQLNQGLPQIHGGHSTAELRISVHVMPPGGIPSRWKDSMRQSMLTGFIRPSTQIKLDYAVLVIAKALCSRPLPLVRRRANIAKITAQVSYAEREEVIIEVYRDDQFYNIHMR